VGWLFGYSNRRLLIEHLTRPYTTAELTQKCLARYCSGNNLWAVFEQCREDQEPSRFIALFLMRNSKEGWGYKDLSECMGPCEVTCPLSFLAMVPPSNPEWRESVRAYHRRVGQKLKVGDSIRLTNGQFYTVVETAPLVGSDAQGVRWRIPRRMLTLPDEASPVL